MSSIIRSAARCSNQLSRAAPATAGARAFHSPFRVLDNSPLTRAPSPTSKADHLDVSLYEKQYDPSPDNFASLNGYRTYVVSAPEAGAGHYQVPAGAYPTSAPYVEFASTDAPVLNQAEISSTSADILAHPFLTHASPQNPSGIGASAALRHGLAPGMMGKMGGSHDGAGLVDRKGTKPGTGKLGDRNPQPDGPAAAKFSEAGNKNAWKMRI